MYVMRMEQTILKSSERLLINPAGFVFGQHYTAVSTKTVPHNRTKTYTSVPIGIMGSDS